MTPNRSDGFWLIPHIGILNEISPIVGSLSINNYRIVISFSLGVVRHKILDNIGEITHLISCKISQHLLNDTTMSKISLRTPVCGLIKPKPLKSCVINEFLQDFSMKRDMWFYFLMTPQQLCRKPCGFLVLLSSVKKFSW